MCKMNGSIYNSDRLDVNTPSLPCVHQGQNTRTVLAKSARKEIEVLRLTSKEGKVRSKRKGQGSRARAKNSLYNRREAARLNTRLTVLLHVADTSRSVVRLIYHGSFALCFLNSSVDDKHIISVLYFTTSTLNDTVVTCRCVNRND